MQTGMKALMMICLVFIMAASAWPQEPPEAARVLRAKLAIQIKSGEKTASAASRERVRAGDLLRIFVAPEEDCTVYVIHTDESSVSLLSVSAQDSFTPLLILPSTQGYYTIDGNSGKETITIVCSRVKLPELEPVETNRMTLTTWRFLHYSLARQSQVLVSGQTDKPFCIAGNVRGVDTISADSSSDDDVFIRDIQTYSGKGILVKDYEFMVKK